MRWCHLSPGLRAVTRRTRSRSSTAARRAAIAPAARDRLSARAILARRRRRSSATRSGRDRPAVVVPAGGRSPRAPGGDRGSGSSGGYGVPLDPDRRSCRPSDRRSSSSRSPRPCSIRRPGRTSCSRRAGLPGARARRAVGRRRCVRLPLAEADGFLPDLDAITRSVGARRDPVAQLPEQPDRRGRAARVPRGDAAERCRAHDVLLASDEAYSELWFGEGPPPARCRWRT